MAVLVLALNPSIDAEWRVDRVQWEEKNVIQSECRWAGGKGVNVARWLKHLEGRPRLLLPLGGATGRELTTDLRRRKLAATVVPLRESSRVNVIVTTAGCGQLRFNQPGPELSRAEWQRILRETGELLLKVSCVVLSGSLPRGVPVDAYAQLIRLAHGAGVKAILDCDGEALRAAVGARPFLIKPNEHELAEWAGRRFKSEASLARAARALSEASRGWVLVSRGQEGGVLVHQREGVLLHARSPKVTPVSTVGAGDAMLAAVVRQIELGAAPEEWLRYGVEIGAVATQLTAGNLPNVE
ncbi:MAG: tagatose-6-phosphate kinase [Pedosphaera sp.]|nr:tagatose-6-phosphate kinase [Pedosphaera sp.]